LYFSSGSFAKPGLDIGSSAKAVTGDFLSSFNKA
jgi:hypothetical protein